MSVEQAPFNTTLAGRPVSRFTLTHGGGMTVQVINFGAAPTSVRVPDRKGDLGEVTLRFDRLEPYLDNLEYMGVVIGPLANRIGGAAFTLKDVRYELEANEGANNLHGGSAGFSCKLWQAEDASDARNPAVSFSINRPDGEGYYPGNLSVTETYRLTKDNELRWEY